MKNPAADLASRLCPECGLCCNGVIFADVRLQRGDDARGLAALGLTLRGARSREKFAQPCSCFTGGLCVIYPNRPSRCAAFECGVFKRVAAGGIIFASALKKIERARRLSDSVRKLLRRLGDNEEALALTKRYARVMAQPMDLSGDPESCDARGELMLAVNDLMQLLHREFLL